jgi:uncharacterized DUF497 family protein
VYAQKFLDRIFFVHTVIRVEISYDPAKNARNIANRGLSFDRAVEFDFETALFEVDARRNYGEERVTAIGRLGGVPHVLVFTFRGEVLRVISFRKANKREVQRYEQATQP